MHTSYNHVVSMTWLLSRGVSFLSLSSFRKSLFTHVISVMVFVFSHASILL